MSCSMIKSISDEKLSSPAPNLPSAKTVQPHPDKSASKLLILPRCAVWRKRYWIVADKTVCAASLSHSICCVMSSRPARSDSATISAVLPRQMRIARKAAFSSPADCIDVIKWVFATLIWFAAWPLRQGPTSSPWRKASLWRY